VAVYRVMRRFLSGCALVFWWREWANGQVAVVPAVCLMGRIEGVPRNDDWNRREDEGVGMQEKGKGKREERRMNE